MIKKITANHRQNNRQITDTVAVKHGGDGGNRKLLILLELITAKLPPIITDSYARVFPRGIYKDIPRDGEYVAVIVGVK